MGKNNYNRQKNNSLINSTASRNNADVCLISDPLFNENDDETDNVIKSEYKPELVLEQVNNMMYDHVTTDSIQILDSWMKDKGNDSDNILDENVQVRCKKKKQSDIDREIVQKFYNNPTPEMFTMIWNRFYYGVHTHAYKIYGDWERAADAVQDTFQRAWEKKSTFDPDRGNYSTWLYTICYNICVSAIKRENSEKCVDIDVSDIFDQTMCPNGVTSEIGFTDRVYYTTSTTGVIEENTYDDIEKKIYDVSISEINNMEPLFKKIIIMKDVDNMTLREIARRLDMKESKIKNCYYKNREILSDKIKEKYSELYSVYKESLKEKSDAENIYTSYKSTSTTESDYYTMETTF